jgi:glutathione S-transferase
VTAKLYVILGSHACRTGILTLEHKRIDYRTVVLPTGLHPFLVSAIGFPGKANRLAGGRKQISLAIANRFGTVPALRYGSDRVQTNREISRYLERVRPDPPLFPADPDRRRAAEEAERWGDEVFQMTARRLGLSGVLHGPDAMVDRGRDGRLGPILWRHDWVRLVGARFVGRTTFATGLSSDVALLESLPEMLDRIDGWVEAGVLNGPDLNAADFMIAPSVALLTYRRDLVGEVEGRPVRALLDRVLPAPATR